MVEKGMIKTYANKRSTASSFMKNHTQLGAAELAPPRSRQGLKPPSTMSIDEHSHDAPNQSEANQDTIAASI